MCSRPLVSIIVAVYNQLNVVKQALESIINQTYENIEIIVSDDCSTDGTQEVLSRIASTNPKIRLFLQEKNLGITNNYNFLAAKVNGKYVAVFAGDDVMCPEKIEKQIVLLENNPDSSFCHHAVTILGYTSNKIQGVITHKYVNGITTIHDVLRNLGIPGAMSIVCRRTALKVPVFSPDIPTASDWLFIIHLTMTGKGLYIEEPLCFYRKDSDYNGKDPTQYENDFLQTIDVTRATYASLGDEIDKSCDYALARYSLGAGYRRLIRGEQEKARTLFKLAMPERKLMVKAFVLYILSIISVSSRLLIISKQVYKKISQ